MQIILRIISAFSSVNMAIKGLQERADLNPFAQSVTKEDQKAMSLRTIAGSLQNITMSLMIIDKTLRELVERLEKKQ